MTLEEIRDAKNLLEAQLKELEHKEKEFLDSPQGLIDRVVDKLAEYLWLTICHETQTQKSSGNYYIWNGGNSDYSKFLNPHLNWDAQCTNCWMKTREEVNLRVMKYYLANS